MVSEFIDKYPTIEQLIYSSQTTQTRIKLQKFLEFNLLKSSLTKKAVKLDPFSYLNCRM